MRLFSNVPWDIKRKGIFLSLALLMFAIASLFASIGYVANHHHIPPFLKLLACIMVWFSVLLPIYQIHVEKVHRSRVDSDRRGE